MIVAEMTEFGSLCNRKRSAVLEYSYRNRIGDSHRLQKRFRTYRNSLKWRIVGVVAVVVVAELVIAERTGLVVVVVVGNLKKRFPTD